MLFQLIALANEAAPAAGDAAADANLEAMPFDPTTILMLVALVAVMYFMLIRPQKKKEKAKKLMLSQLEKGDTITTIGGIMGKITKLRDDEVYIETGMVGNPNERSTMRVTKWAISDVTKKADTKSYDDDVVDADEDSAE